MLKVLHDMLREILPSAFALLFCILIFFSGFALFEALFSWCGFYAALGKSTCPIE
jgi:hypothetical protein